MKKVRVSLKKNDTLVGLGLFSSGLKLVKSGLQKVLGTKTTVNKDWDYKPKSNPTENHAIFKVDGNYYRAQWAGPKTHIEQNLSDAIADHGSITGALQDSNFAVPCVDKESMAHDLRYALSSITDNAVQAIREADNKFVEKLQECLKDGEDPVNVQPSLKAIQTKILAEKNGVLDPLKFAGLEKYDPATTKQFQDVLAHLEMQGYGPVENKNRAERPSEYQMCGCGSYLKQINGSHMNSKKHKNYELTKGLN